MAGHARQDVPTKHGNLGQLAFFHGADSDLLAQAARSATWLVHGPDQIVLDFGDNSQDVFLIVEGAVRVMVSTPLGQEMIIGDLVAGDILGDVAAIDGATRSASVVTLHPTRLCRLPADVFLDLALRAPVVGLRLLRLLTARLRREDERMFELTALPARERLAAELMRLSRPRPGGGRVITPPLPQQVLAARIGARRETVSLALDALAREGLIQLSSPAIVILSPDKLRAAINARLHGDATRETSLKTS